MTTLLRSFKVALTYVLAFVGAFITGYLVRLALPV